MSNENEKFIPKSNSHPSGTESSWKNRADIPGDETGFYYTKLKSGAELYTHLAAYDFVHSLPVESLRQVDLLIISLINNKIIPLSRLIVFLYEDIESTSGHKLGLQMIQKKATKSVAKMVQGTELNNRAAEYFGGKTGIGSSLQMLIPKDTGITAKNISDYIDGNPAFDKKEDVVLKIEVELDKPYTLGDKFPINIQMPEKEFFAPIDEIDI